MGKHPGYGDFVAHGVSDDMRLALSGWMDTTLSQLRDQLGDEAWPAFWDSAQSLRFWAGRGVLGKTVAGVMLPSRDKVGRRYPLMLLVEGVHLAAPIKQTDQTFYDVLSRHAAKMSPGEGAAALVAGVQVDAQPESAEMTAQGPVIWAHRPDGDVEALLQSAAPVDAERALTARSYWWAEASDGRAAAWMGHPGLPGPQALGWLLSGVALEQDEEGTTDGEQ